VEALLTHMAFEIRSTHWCRMRGCHSHWRGGQFRSAVGRFGAVLRHCSGQA